MKRNLKQSDDPHEWLKRARSNLVRSKDRIPDVYLEDLCYDAQQAVEKAIKGLLIYLGVSFPFVHSISELLTIVEDAGRKVPNEIKESAKLTEYAVESRYPGVAEPVTEQEYKEAIELAERVVAWAEKMIGSEPEVDAKEASNHELRTPN